MLPLLWLSTIWGFQLPRYNVDVSHQESRIALDRRAAITAIAAISFY